MRNLLTARWRHYTAAFVIAAAGLGVVGACTPAKDQPPASTLLTIAPNEFTYTSQGQVKDFTVTNLGPGPSTSLHTALLGGNASPSEFVVNPGGTTA